MKSYDKAAWHIDSGEDIENVVSRFKDMFDFLNEKKMLNEEGIETLEYGMDSSVSLNSRMINEEGVEFLDQYYDEIIGKDPTEIKNNFYKAYEHFQDAKSD